MASNIDPDFRASWYIPAFEIPLWLGRQHLWCVVIPVINEGNRIKSLLSKMQLLKINKIAEIIIVDGGSTDNSLELQLLQKMGVSGLLLKTGPGKLSAQLQCAYAFAIDQGYEGVVTIDGNDKDDPKAIPGFIKELSLGADFVQGSRFVDGGVAENTPKSRDLAIRYIHAPMLSLFSGFRWTDTTQGFRAYSRNLLSNSDLSIFRDVFKTYELLAYMSYRAPKLGFKCKEIPSIRRYPSGKIPTKISMFRGNMNVLKILFLVCLGFYN